MLRSARAGKNHRCRCASEAAIIAGIRTSAAGIVADDMTVVGAGNDVLLIPLAQVAIATYVLADGPASSAELGRA
ncbi:MAG: hypothetical protein AAGC55_31650 [Myxococcota bacterium]